MQTALPNGCTPLGSEAPAASQEESQSLTCDFSACEEHSPGSPDNDCCGWDDQTFCPQGYIKSKVLTSQPGVRWINAPAGFPTDWGGHVCSNTAPYNGNTCCHSAQTPTLCIRDDSKCSSDGDDCCACDASIGQTTCGWEEPATCRDGYVAMPTPDGREGWPAGCEYSCYPPHCAPPPSSSPPPCAGDDSKCSSAADDCCACDPSIGQTTCGFEEPATCRDGYVAVPTPGADGGMHSNPSCEYSCYPPHCHSSLVGSATYTPVSGRGCSSYVHMDDPQTRTA